MTLSCIKNSLSLVKNDISMHENEHFTQKTFMGEICIFMHEIFIFMHGKFCMKFSCHDFFRNENFQHRQEEAATFLIYMSMVGRRKVVH